MSTNFPQYLGDDSTQDPYAALIAAQEKRLAQEMKPAFSPGEQARRLAENAREYQLGILGQLSGDEALSGVGGQVLKQAIAARTPRVTERGTADPLRGTFTYSPEFLREQEQAKLEKLQQGQAGYFSKRSEAREKYAAQLERDRERAEDRKEYRALMAANRQEPLVAVIGADGNPVYLPRSQAQGMRPAPTGAAQPSEGERKAATLLQRLKFSQGQLAATLAENPGAELPEMAATAAGGVPFVGDDLSNYAKSGARQQIEDAQLDILDAALTLGTGAAYTREQLKGYARSYFPRLGDSQKNRADKAARLNNVIKAAEIAAGRAAPQALSGANGGGADSADPLGFRR